MLKRQAQHLRQLGGVVQGIGGLDRQASAGQPPRQPRPVAAAMANSVVDHSEQRQLAALFVELDEVLHKDAKLAGLVTFWRHQLHAGVEPSHLPELLEVLDALSDSRLADGDLHTSVRHWQVVLRSRAPRDGKRSGDHDHPDLV